MVRDKYKEIKVLRDMLEEEGVPFDYKSGFLNGIGIAYPSFDNVICSVIEHDGSYGRNEDLLEIMGLLTEAESKYDEVVGGLSATDVLERIKSHYELNK